MAAGLDVGTLSGRVELEDRMSSVLDLLAGRVENLDKTFGGFGARFAEQVGSFFTAQALFTGVSQGVELLSESIATLTLHGAEVDDVAGNFEHLTQQAGRLGSTLLGELRAGTHGTIDDFELIKLANQDLAAGLELTDDQFRTVADGAFALAQATGGSVKEALDKMNDALLTGRTRSLEMLTGKIDLVKVEEDYAKSLGTTSERLTEDEKLQAKRAAILDKVSEATTRLGEQTDGLDEIVAQAQATFTNYVDQLSQLVATSPVVMAGLTGIRDALTEAFGGSQEDLIQSIAKAIDDGLIKLVDFGIAATDVGSAVGSFAASAYQGFLFLRQGVDGVLLGIEGLSLGLVHLIDLLPGIDMSDEIARINGNIDSLMGSITERNASILQAEDAEQAWQETMGATRVALEGIREKMVAAQEAGDEHRTTQEGLATATSNAAAAQGEQNIVLGTGQATFRQTAEEAKKLAAAQEELASIGKSVKETLAALPAETIKNVKGYLDMGVSLGTLATAYGLTQSQATAIQKTWQAEQDVLQKAAKAAKEKAEALQLVTDAAVPLEKTLAGIGDLVEMQVKQYLELGGSAETAAKAFGLTDTQVKAIQKSMGMATTDAEELAQALKNTVGGAVSELTGKVQALNGQWETLQERAERQSGGGSFQINRGNLAENARQWKIPETVAEEGAKRGMSFQEILQAFQTNKMAEWIPAGPRIPGFREGGMGDFGSGTLAMLHGKEAIVPLDRMGEMAPNITIYVNGTAQEVAKKVSAEIMKNLKSARQFGAA